MSSVGPTLAGTGANDATVGSFQWDNPGNITADDGSNATAGYSFFTTGTFTSNYLKGTNFGFSIPSGATIDGIVFEYKVQASATSPTSKDAVVSLVKGGVVSGSNKAIGTDFASGFSTISYGSSSDLWGLSWTDTDINASNFGAVLQVSVTRDSFGDPFNIPGIDSFKITVYYTATATRVVGSMLTMFQ